MTGEIPEFRLAVQQMQGFLEREGHPARLAWVFLDDIYRAGLANVSLRTPLPEANPALSAKVFEEGRAKGLVSITAIATMRDTTAVTVWFPKHDVEEVQGWSVGLKLSISKPLPKARTVPSALWPLFRLLPSYRRYQRHECMIGTRTWAAD